MLLNELRQKRQQILDACLQYGASNIRVFGSVARGEETQQSDIDFLVELPEGYDMFKQRLALQERLEEITEKKLDLIPEHELNKHIQATVLKEAIAL